METYRTTFGIVKDVVSAQGEKSEVSQVISDVYAALCEKGYNPINQMVGYIMSGDPTYITNHNGARARITSVERDELVEEFVSLYFKSIAGNEEK
ncbi:MAG: IreB family regulatory phosphoprotein [Clostridia bacterium]|nr:IreB family regulatory phosphoprotein [Clostridia bacterium]